MQAVCYLRAVPEAPLDTQQAAALAECVRLGLDVGPTYVETAPGPDSPEFRRMVRTLLEGDREPAEVVVGALEALGDTVRVQARRCLQLAALDIALHVAGSASPDAALVAAWERRSSRERRREQVRAGMREVALRGEVLGRPPYGYRVVARRLRVDPAEADIVRDIFHRYLDLGEGVRVIARALNEAGRRTRRGGAWTMVSVREVLRNPVYIGTYRRLGVLVTSDHERLVTAERFHEVQRRLQERRTAFDRQARGEYLLAGIAACGYCGNLLVGSRRASRAQLPDGAERPVFTYYQCQSRTNQSRCDYHTRRAVELEAAVRDALREVAADLPAVEAAGAPPVGASAGAGGPPNARREALRRQLDGCLERWMRGEWTAERLRQEAGPVALEDLQEEEREAFEVRRTREAASRTAPGARPADVLVSRWDDLPFEERRRLLRLLVARIVVTDDAVRIEPARATNGANDG